MVTICRIIHWSALKVTYNNTINDTVGHTSIYRYIPNGLNNARTCWHVQLLQVENSFNSTFILFNAYILLNA